jgi:hypothetical protein
MTITSLYDIADKNNIMLVYLPLRSCGSVSTLDDNGLCAIGLDPHRLETSADERTRLSHELGHCMTYSFYNRYSRADIRGKHEYRANKWAVHTVVPYTDLQFAFEQGYTEVWELAEFFNVTEDMIRTALYMYRCEDKLGA